MFASLLRRIAFVGLALLLLSGDAFAGFQSRAREVAARWQGSALDRAWRTGFVSLEVLNPWGWDRAGRVPYWAARSAHNGAWELDAELPDEAPAPVELSWPDGSTSRVPVVPAAAAFEKFRHGPDLNEDPCPKKCRPLVVTGVELGRVPLETSRGVIQVPAWKFAVRDVDRPFVHVAVEPSAVTEKPRPAKGFHRHFWKAEPVAGRPAELRVRYGFGECDVVRGPFVHETDQVVVIGMETTLRPDAGACNEMLLTDTATVRLSRPLGDRIVLDLGTWLPVTDDH
ncbi:hypothetical protein [Herbidospora sp. RD11066]